MECPFVVGQKVVCVDKCWKNKSNSYPDEIFPTQNQIYTIRTIELVEDGPHINVVVVRLIEIVNKTREYVGGRLEPRFYHWHFKPLQETKTDISVFNKLLNPAPKEKITTQKRILEKV